MAGVMNWVQMSRSLRSFLFMGLAGSVTNRNHHSKIPKSDSFYSYHVPFLAPHMIIATLLKHLWANFLFIWLSKMRFAIRPFGISPLCVDAVGVGASAHGPERLHIKLRIVCGIVCEGIFSLKLK